MAHQTLIKNATIINEGSRFLGSVLLDGEIITDIFQGETLPRTAEGCDIIDGKGKYLIPGIIDDQVHFREPGLTHKGDIYTESRAAVAGGITSFMEMPNTNPQTITQTLLEEKYQIGAEKSLANYSFYIGATNTNLEELLKTDPASVCGIKIFMGSSTGNMLVNDPDTLKGIFEHSPMLIAVHCEDEQTVQQNLAQHIQHYGDNIPIKCHPVIRSEEACYRSSAMAVELASKYNTRLHILHLSTAREIGLFQGKTSVHKRITGEVCVHHIWFHEGDYDRLGSFIKWNPAIKTRNDRDQLLEALVSDRLDVIATDHAPHTLSEKNNNYTHCPSGGPLVQHSLNVMLELVNQQKISLEQVIAKMCHHPAILFQIQKRGFIRKGYYADLVLIDPECEWTVQKDNLLYKCGWSPFEGQLFKGKVTHTFVNGHLAYHQGNLNDTKRGMRLRFNR